MILFCSDPLDERVVDPEFHAEWAQARKRGFETALFSYEDLVHFARPEEAIRKVAGGQPGKALYRGWMLSVRHYEQLYEALAERAISLITSPAEYRHCHYLPEVYAQIEGITPRSVWLPANEGLTDQALIELLGEFGALPVIVKDYVKSRKHEWNEACFIPDASDTPNATRVIRRFLELQGEDLSEGIVLREYVPLAPLAGEPNGPMPRTEEWRAFFLHGSPIGLFPYWEGAGYPTALPDLGPFLDTARRIQSRFFTMDIAKTESGDWIIVEVGDGQVSGLLADKNVPGFYTALRESWRC